MITQTLDALTTVAQAIGFVVLGIIGLLVAVTVISSKGYQNASDEAKQAGAEMQKKHGYDSGLSAMVVDGLLDEMEEIGDDINIEYEPAPDASFDWSTNRNMTAQDVREAMAGIQKTGLYVHPFPRSPDDMGADEWFWSDGHAGVWFNKPEFYVKTDGERREVEPDLSDWQPAEP